MRLGLLLACGALLAACSNIDLDKGLPPIQEGVLNPAIYSDTRPRPPGQFGGPERPVGERGLLGDGEIYLGNGARAEAGPPVAPAAGEATYQLNFENADLQDVIRSLLGDALQLTYTVDPSVSGRVTLSSARKIARNELLPILETVLRMNGAVLVDQGGIYRVGLLEPGMTTGPADRAGEGIRPGFGITVVPLRHVSAQVIMGLIDGFAVQPGQVRVFSNANILLIQGTSAERQTAVQTAQSFDVDWMRDQAVGIFPVRRASPEAVIAELERIFETRDGGLGAQTVQFQPIARLKGILVVSKRSQLVRSAGDWIKRLDREDVTAGVGAHVYRARYRAAKDLADILEQTFAPAAAAAGARSGDQIEPRAGIAQATAQPDRGAQPGGPGAAMPSVVADTTARQGARAAADFRVNADPVNNSLIIYADGNLYQKILRTLREIDRPPLQVAIGVTIAEIRLNDHLRYGVQYFIKSKNLGMREDVGSIGLFNTLVNNISRELPGLNFVIGAEASPDIIIDALDQVTDVEILSAPSVVVLENQNATLQVGEEIPVATRQAQAVEDGTAPIINQIEFRNTGIILNVTPRIGVDGTVVMTIEQEISTVTSATPTLTPTISQRKVATTISVNNGQTVLLGGLISARREKDRAGIPGLHRLETIGDLFGRTANEAQRSELIILIRPTVVRDGYDAQNVAEELKSRMWLMNSARQPYIKP